MSGPESFKVVFPNFDLAADANFGRAVVAATLSAVFRSIVTNAVLV